MLHIERLTNTIENMSKHHQERRVSRKNDLCTAEYWLKQNTATSILLERLQVLMGRERHWDGVVPCTPEPLNSTFKVDDGHPESVTVIGVDGSQIYTDRHAAVPYYLIQCGALIFRYNESRPEAKSIERLFYEDDALYDERGYLISNEAINEKRTTLEMEYIADLCISEVNNPETVHIYALTDGPLLWSTPGSDQHISPNFKAYLSALSKIKLTGVGPVGYVDRPGGKWFLDLLWINQIPDDEFPPHTESCPISSLTDVEIMEILLAPGHRTSWFKRHNTSQTVHTREGHEIWFCYMNLGKTGTPNIVRLEVPNWFAQDEGRITVMHNMIIHQAYALNGYPYVLARAHEMALVTTQDKTALNTLLQRKLMEQGIFTQTSEKARQKSFLGHR